MLTLILGGAYQNKKQLALSLGRPVMDRFHLTIREWVDRKADIGNELALVLEQRDIVIVSDEIGCGIIPLDKKEREVREITGRVLCDIAAKAGEVYRVHAGIPMKIKGAA